MIELPLRVWLSLALVGLAAVAVALVDGGAVAAFVTLGFGAAAVLIASWGETPDVVADTPPEPETAIDLDAALDAIVEPVLVLRENRIVQANRAARELLGEHIVGEDARTAIRHPAAAGPLSRLHPRQ